MSSKHAKIEHSFGRWVLEDTGSKNGTVVNGAPTRRAVLNDGDLIELGHTLFLFCAGEPMSADDPIDVDLADAPEPAPGLHTLLVELARDFARLGQVAMSPIPILIEGPSGTGKEVLARAAHQLSGRRGEFIAVNCGAIPANLVESELFGYRKGAFSGAVEDRPGLIRSADHGTIFLDEIGDLPAPSQAALLRVLQEREVTPVGAARPIQVDIRVIAATHRDLDALITEEKFRRDLFARLAGFRVGLPPLAERKQDLGLLIGVLFARAARNPETHPGFECESVRQMFAYGWPLNIRELEQCIRTALVLAGDEPVGIEHLPEAVLVEADPSDAPAPAVAKLSAEDERQRDDLIAQLGEHKGNISAVARATGKDRKQIQRWMKRFQLNADDYR